MPSNDNEYILLDEGVIKDLISVFGKAMKFNADYKTNLNRIKAQRLTQTSSISRAAKNLIMSFPTICSDAVSGNTAAIINKAVEIKNVTMIQMIAAAAHFTGFNGLDVVSKLHTNMGVNYNVDDYIDSILAFKDTLKTVGEGYIPLSGAYRILAEQMKEEFLDSCNKTYPVTSFNETAISDYYVVDSYGSPKVMYEARRTPPIYASEFDKKKFEYQKQKDAQDRADNYQKEKQRKKEHEEDSAYKQRQDAERNKQQRISNQINLNNYELNKNKQEYQKQRDAEQDAYQKERDAKRDAETTYQQKHYNITQNLSAMDVKKANELIPTMIVLRYQVGDPNADPSKTNLYISDEFVAGVKSRLIPCSSQDIVDRIINYNKSQPNMKGLIKATTGETKFAKDFLASIQDAKIQAKKDSKLSKTNSIWRSLQARSNRSKLNRLTRMQNGSAAISTLVITQQEVDMVKDEYNIDMNNPKVAIDFMDAYNLMALVIVDEPLEVAHFIYDGDAYFEDLSFSALQRENDKSYKQVIDLLNKSR